jgi:Kef-type K+ transport system membrane component KefB
VVLAALSQAPAAPAAEGAPVPRELEYVALLFALFIVPRLLQRLRIPTAITSLALGALAGLGYGLFLNDTTIQLLAGLGIVALFLFAGLDVRFDELRREGHVVLQHLAIHTAALGAVAAVVGITLKLPTRPAILIALALLTPSTGFILDSLAAFHLSDQERFWIKAKAIAHEILALGVLFFTLQSATATQLAESTGVLLAMVALLPVVFRFFAKRIAPYAPKSEFTFLVMLAVLAAMVTLRLGVYYLVGAFLVGVMAQRFQEHLPALGSERMLHAVELFAGFFVPFYFFHVGVDLHGDDFSLGALVMGIAFLGLVVPFRLGLVALHRLLALGEPPEKGVRIGLSMIPTLVFTLVIAGILRDRYNADPLIFGGLIVYTLGNTLIPGFALRQPLPEFGPFPEAEDFVWPPGYGRSTASHEAPRDAGGPS